MNELAVQLKTGDSRVQKNEGWIATFMGVGFFRKCLWGKRPDLSKSREDRSGQSNGLNIEQRKYLSTRRTMRR